MPRLTDVAFARRCVMDAYPSWIGPSEIANKRGTSLTSNKVTRLLAQDDDHIETRLVSNAYQRAKEYRWIP